MMTCGVPLGLGIKYHVQIKNIADMYRTHSCHTPLQPQQRVDAGQWGSISQLEAAITQLQAHQHELTMELARLHELVEENKQREDPRIRAQVELVQVTLEKQINLVADRAFATEHELTTRMDALEERVMSLQTPPLTEHKGTAEGSARISTTPRDTAATAEISGARWNDRERKPAIKCR